jgi:threonine dehydratase
VTLAEGIAVRSPGRLTRPVVEALVEDIVLVGESAIERAVCLLAGEAKLVAEGAGAAGVAALLQHANRFAGRRVGAVLCGGNIDMRLLASVLLRGLVREGRLVRLRVVVTDAPGAMAAVTRLIGEAGANIVEIFHHRLTFAVPAKQAELDIVVESRNAGHVQSSSRWHLVSRHRFPAMAQNQRVTARPAEGRGMRRG